MGTVALIVFGIVAISIFGVVGDVISKVAQARIKARESAGAAAPQEEIEALHRRINALETRLEDREDAVKKLQDEVRFVTRMLEDRSSGSGKA
jgi:predicted RNase H-like nuclease (RuvC/YqgF family)